MNHVNVDMEQYKKETPYGDNTGRPAQSDPMMTPERAHDEWSAECKSNENQDRDNEGMFITTKRGEWSAQCADAPS